MILKKSLFRTINWVSRTFFASRLSYAHIEAFIFNNSWRRVLNLVHVHWDIWRGKPVTNSKPYIVILEVTNICNLHCPFCLTGKGISGGRDVRHMKFEEAKKVIDAVGDYAYFLQLYTWGEPLLNKDIIPIIEYAKQKRIFVMLSTNATAMTPAYNKRLIDSGVDYIMVAIDGGSDETYEKYRVGGNYTKVLQNVEDLLQQKREQNATTPFVEWQFIVFRHNEHEVDSTEKMAYEIGINKFTPLPAYVEDESWMPVGERYRTLLYNPERLKNCDRPWSHLNIRADGGVASCCYEFFKKDDFGDIKQNSFDEVWNNGLFLESRKLIRQYSKGKKMDDSSIICHGCLKSGIRPSYIETPTDTQRIQQVIPVSQLRKDREKADAVS